MKNKETVIQNEIIKYLNHEGIPHWRISGASNMAGFPDLLVCYKGYFVSLEVKTDNGKATEQQVITMDRINKSGGCAGVVRSVYDVDLMLRCIRENMKERYKFNIDEDNLQGLGDLGRWLTQ